MRDFGINWLAAAVFAIGAIVGPTHASLTQTTGFFAWQSAAGSFATVTFTEIPPASILNTQYAALGVTFTGGNDSTVFTWDIFPLDGAGVISAGDSQLEMSFTQPMTTLAVHFAGGVQMKFFSQGSLIATSNRFFGSGGGHFAGIVSSQPFDSAILYDPDPFGGFGIIFIDNLYFGPPIPAPAALPLLAIGLISRRRKHG